MWFQLSAPILRISRLDLGRGQGMPMCEFSRKVVSAKRPTNGSPHGHEDESTVSGFQMDSGRAYADFGSSVSDGFDRRHAFAAS